MYNYLDLVAELLLARAHAGGSLSSLEEASFVEELDRRWWAMTTIEQDIAERILKATLNPRSERNDVGG